MMTNSDVMIAINRNRVANLVKEIEMERGIANARRRDDRTDYEPDRAIEWPNIDRWFRSRWRIRRRPAFGTA